MSHAHHLNQLTSGEPAMSNILRNPVPKRSTFVRRLLWSPFELQKMSLLLFPVLITVLTMIHVRIRDGADSPGATDGLSFVNRLRSSGDPLPILLDSVLGTMLFIFVLFWPITVWKTRPFGKRDYCWSLPVDRPEHDLWRVAAGAVHLALVLLLAALVGGAFTLLEGIPIFPTGSWPFWLSFFGLPIALYLATSIPALATSSPGLWLLGVIAVSPVMLLTVGLLDIPGLEDLARILLVGSEPRSDSMALSPTLSHGSTSGTAAWIKAFTDAYPGGEVHFTDRSGTRVLASPLELNSWTSHLSWLLACALWMIPILGGLWLAARRRI